MATEAQEVEHIRALEAELAEQHLAEARAKPSVPEATAEQMRRANDQIAKLQADNAKCHAQWLGEVRIVNEKENQIAALKAENRSLHLRLAQESLRAHQMDEWWASQFAPLHQSRYEEVKALTAERDGLKAQLADALGERDAYMRSYGECVSERNDANLELIRAQARHVGSAQQGVEFMEALNRRLSLIEAGCIALTADKERWRIAAQAEPLGLRAAFHGAMKRTQMVEAELAQTRARLALWKRKAVVRKAMEAYWEYNYILHTEGSPAARARYERKREWYLRIAQTVEGRKSQGETQ